MIATDTAPNNFLSDRKEENRILLSCVLIVGVYHGYVQSYFVNFCQILIMKLSVSEKIASVVQNDKTSVLHCKQISLPAVTNKRK